MERKLTFMKIKMPKGNALPNKPEVIFEGLLAAIHKALIGQEIYFEMVTISQYTSFFINTSKKQATLIESMIYGQFPYAEIEIKNDYLESAWFTSKICASLEMELKERDVLPFRTFDKFEADSLAGLFAILATIPKECLSAVQIKLKPLRKDWKYKWKKQVSHKVHKLFTKKKLGIEEKSKADFFETSIKVIGFSNDKNKAGHLVENIAKSFVQFNEAGSNKFKFKEIKYGIGVSNSLLSRANESTFDLSTREVASIYHFPNPDNTSYIVGINSKKAEPPQALPKLDNEKVSIFGLTNFHNQFEKFGINREDRRRHMYVVGKSGVGKSKLLELLIREDILNGKGVGILDPHGDLVDNVLKFIPEERIKDVIYFDPADVAFPIAFNPLENVSAEYKVRITIGFIDIFKKLFGLSWTSRLEHVLRYTTLALLDTPGTTVFSILKLLTDKSYRQYIIGNIQDSVVKNFWVHEFASWSEKFDSEAITPLLNKVGQFVSTAMIRNIVGQPHNTFDLRKVMDEQKILLVKVSKGMLGEENASLLGSMFITKLQQAAMSRADLPEDQRKDFYLYVDEFQNFATDTFAEILSEARKYRLNLTVAHQYIGQLTEVVRKTVFGNIGNIVNFRVGAEDAEILTKEYSPVFEVKDIINLGVQEFYIKMSINGELGKPFSGQTLPLIFPEENYTARIIEESRRKYTKPVVEVNKMLDFSNEAQLVKATIEPVFEMPIL